MKSNQNQTYPPRVGLLFLSPLYIHVPWSSAFPYNSFRFVSICFVSFCFVSFRFVSFRFDLFRFVSICFVSFRSVSFCSVSFLFRFALYRDPIDVPVSDIEPRCCFFPVERKDCMNSAVCEYRKISARIGAQFVLIEMQTVCWKTFLAKTTTILSTRNSSILMMSSSFCSFRSGLLLNYLSFNICRLDFQTVCAVLS